MSAILKTFGPGTKVTIAKVGLSDAEQNRQRVLDKLARIFSDLPEDDRCEVELYADYLKYRERQIRRKHHLKG